MLEVVPSIFFSNIGATRYSGQSWLNSHNGFWQRSDLKLSGSWQKYRYWSWQPVKKNGKSIHINIDVYRKLGFLIISHQSFVGLC
jgi:hypothetical protein